MLCYIDIVVVPSRVIVVNLSFEDRWIQEEQSRYLRSLEPDIPYIMSNVKFLRWINGLETAADVRNIITGAEYMVLGPGVLYLEAPCAVPVAPHDRMVTSTYNLASPNTSEGASGSGGAYMCIYVMSSYGSIPEACFGTAPSVLWL